MFTSIFRGRVLCSRQLRHGVALSERLFFFSIEMGTHRSSV
jgi:hypothetical protein